MFARMTTALVAAVLALAAPGVAGAREEKISFEDCPAAVQKAINDNADGGKIVEVEKETKKDGTIVYEAEVKKSDGTEVEIEVTEDGRLIGIETDDDDDDDDDSD